MCYTLTEGCTIAHTTIYYSNSLGTETSQKLYLGNYDHRVQHAFCFSVPIYVCVSV